MKAKPPADLKKWWWLDSTKRTDKRGLAIAEAWEIVRRTQFYALLWNTLQEAEAQFGHDPLIGGKFLAKVGEYVGQHLASLFWAQCNPSCSWTELDDQQRSTLKRHHPFLPRQDKPETSARMAVFIWELVRQAGDPVVNHEKRLPLPGFEGIVPVENLDEYVDHGTQRKR